MSRSRDKDAASAAQARGGADDIGVCIEYFADTKQLILRGTGDRANGVRCVVKGDDAASIAAALARLDGAERMPDALVAAFASGVIYGVEAALRGAAAIEAGP